MTKNFKACFSLSEDCEYDLLTNYCIYRKLCAEIIIDLSALAYVELDLKLNFWRVKGLERFLDHRNFARILYVEQ